jgi:hypothetical protein
MSMEYIFVQEEWDNVPCDQASSCGMEHVRRVRSKSNIIGV